MVISQLKDLGEYCFNDKAVMTKLTCRLPPKHESIRKAWESLTEFEKT
jgi:hypothetical protein